MYHPLHKAKGWNESPSRNFVDVAEFERKANIEGPSFASQSKDIRSELAVQDRLTTVGGGVGVGGEDDDDDLHDVRHEEENPQWGEFEFGENLEWHGFQQDFECENDAVDVYLFDTIVADLSFTQVSKKTM